MHCMINLLYIRHLLCESVYLQNTVLISNDIIFVSSVLIQHLNVHSIYKISGKNNQSFHV